MDLYSALMEEIKIRLGAIEHAVKGQTHLVGPLVREFSYLQLRMICEVIALGSLVAHGDIDATKANKFRKEYAADKILDQLEALHPNFYPQPAIQAAHDTHHLVPLTSGFITKPELLALYHQCGDTLHRGNFKKLLSPRTPIQSNFAEVWDGIARRASRTRTARAR